jgi:hypothetical protein
VGSSLEVYRSGLEVRAWAEILETAKVAWKLEPSNSHHRDSLQGRARHSVSAVRSRAQQDWRARSDAPYQADIVRIAVSNLERLDRAIPERMEKAECRSPAQPHAREGSRRNVECGRSGTATQSHLRAIYKPTQSLLTWCTYRVRMVYGPAYNTCCETAQNP